MTDLMLRTQAPASIVLLRSARGAFCGKTFTASTTAPEGFTEQRPEPGLKWHPTVASFGDLPRLQALLLAAAKLGDAVVIRGALSRDLTDEEQAAGIYRRLVDGGFANGLWVPCARTWVALDLDGSKVPENVAADPWVWLAEHLPEPFKQASFVWNRTASSGIKPGFRGRLFFILDEPVTDAQLRAWTRTAPEWMKLDDSLFSANQPHYIASPRFEGLHDPLQGCPRWGLHTGLVNEVPAAAFLRLAPAGEDPQRVGFVLDDLPAEPNLAEIERRLERIRAQTSHGSRHNHANGAACELIGLGMAPELVELEVEDLIRRGGREPGPGEGYRAVKHALGKLQEGRLLLTQQPLAKVLASEPEAPPAADAPPPVSADEIVAEAPASLYGANDMLNAGMYAHEVYPEGGFMRWAEQDWEWVGTHWRKLENDEVLAQRIQRHTRLKNARAVATTKSFRALMARERLNPPCTMSGDPLPRLLVFQNGVLPLDDWLLDPSTPLLPHDPQRFVTGVLPYDYDPQARCPCLDAFLDSIWPEEKQQDQRIEYQKMLGYLLLPENPLHKMFIILGKARSGKGTTLRLIRQLVGPQNCCAPTLSSLTNNFGLDSLMGKTVALVGELNQQGRIPDTAIDRLKSISGGDDLPVNRKNKSEVHQHLPVRFVVACNRLPGFLDPSGAFAARQVIFTMWRSFLGKEDIDLGRKLSGELPGIAQFALAGLRRLLVEDGTFLPLGSTRWVAKSFRDVQAPTATFLSECVRPGGSDDWLANEQLYAIYCAWARENGHNKVSAARLHSEIDMLWPEVAAESKRKRGRLDGNRVRFRSHFALTAVGLEYAQDAALAPGEVVAD